MKMTHGYDNTDRKETEMRDLEITNRRADDLNAEADEVLALPGGNVRENRVKPLNFFAFFATFCSKKHRIETEAHKGSKGHVTAFSSLRPPVQIISVNWIGDGG